VLELNSDNVLLKKGASDNVAVVIVDKSPQQVVEMKNNW